MYDVLVKFEDSSKNYTTQVNDSSSLTDVRDYFVGTEFNLGYDEDNLYKCVGITINNQHHFNLTVYKLTFESGKTCLVESKLSLDEMLCKYIYRKMENVTTDSYDICLNVTVN